MSTPMISMVAKGAILADDNSSYDLLFGKLKNIGFTTNHITSLGMDFAIRHFEYANTINIELQQWMLSVPFARTGLEKRVMKGAKFVIILPNAYPKRPHPFEKLINNFPSDFTNVPIFDQRDNISLQEFMEFGYDEIFRRFNLLTLFPKEKKQEVYDRLGISTLTMEDFMEE